MPEVWSACMAGSSPTLPVVIEVARRMSCRGEEFVFVKASPAEREAFLYADPATFFVTAHYANAPGVIVRLSKVDPDALRELLVEAWRAVARKRLVKAYDQSAM